MKKVRVCVCVCVDRMFLCAHDLVQTGDTLNVIHACMPETYLSLSLSLSYELLGLMLILSLNLSRVYIHICTCVCVCACVCVCFLGHIWDIYAKYVMRDRDKQNIP